MADDGYITLQELFHRIDAAILTMSERNPHRDLFAQCKVAIANLASRVPDGPVMTKGGIILP